MNTDLYEAKADIWKFQVGERATTVCNADVHVVCSGRFSMPPAKQTKIKQGGSFGGLYTFF